MPSFKVHLLGGATTYLLCAQLLKFSTFNHHINNYHHILLLGLALLGSIFPDIDIASKMQKIFFKTILVILPLLLFFKYVLSFIVLALISLALIVIRHRTLTHRTWFLLALSFTIGISMCIKYPNLSQIIVTGCVFFFFGSTSHLILDYGIKRFFKKK